MARLPKAHEAPQQTFAGRLGSGDRWKHQLRVSGAGHYEIKLEELRPAGADHAKRVEAERLFTQGLSEARKVSFSKPA
jgi:hypothetical protein